MKPSLLLGGSMSIYTRLSRVKWCCLHRIDGRASYVHLCLTQIVSTQKLNDMQTGP